MDLFTKAARDHVAKIRFEDKWNRLTASLPKIQNEEKQQILEHNINALKYIDRNDFLDHSEELIFLIHYLLSNTCIFELIGCQTVSGNSGNVSYIDNDGELNSILTTSITIPNVRMNLQWYDNHTGKKLIPYGEDLLREFEATCVRFIRGLTPLDGDINYSSMGDVGQNKQAIIYARRKLKDRNGIGLANWMMIDASTHSEFIVNSHRYNYERIFDHDANKKRIICVGKMNFEYEPPMMIYVDKNAGHLDPMIMGYRGNGIRNLSCGLFVCFNTLLKIREKEYDRQNFRYKVLFDSEHVMFCGQIDRFMTAIPINTNWHGMF